ncbi:carbohydrate kinase family protein [Pedobacter sp. ASV28]|uniref:carbohydrate kinase family protein n=1 Tax=Pedobacter sp. ASV28 TaxID=2795123 RepID=UPI0018EC2D27|nr:carbohydrate kinase [Pedobacter sp. ASV28]
MKKIICFGEILWDNLPTGRLAGGAPMNVAYHLRKLGIDASLISRVGDDLAGEDLIAFISSIGTPTINIQIDPFISTSEVVAELKTNNEMSYTISYPTAWDFIEWRKEYEQEILKTDALLFGSLASRHPISQATLLHLLTYARFKVFDVNLRPPYYDKETIYDLLQQAHLVKLNENEIKILGEWFTTSTEEQDQVNNLFEQFNFDEILVTKGAEGGTYYRRKKTIHYKAPEVKVMDTVGSGDSFLAAFLSKKLNGEPIENCLDFAAKMAAFITSLKGACPPYEVEDIK